MRTFGTALAILLFATSAPAQQKPKEVPAPQHPKVDQGRVDEAIQQGCRSLLGACGGEFPHGRRHQPEAMQGTAELVLLTCAHSGLYAEDDPPFEALLQRVLKKKITSTYTASIHAMALQKINPGKYQWRIAQCAQFLADNQATNGQWDYGDPVPFLEERFPTPTGGRGGQREDVATGGGVATASAPPKPAPRKDGGKTTSLPRIPIRRGKTGPCNGDNSNAQYAALGIRACMDGGIVFEPELLLRARQWWLKSQNRDGGWGYNDNGSTGAEAGRENSVGNTSYGSMTVGAVGALCIYDYYLGISYKADPAVLRGMEWIAVNFVVDRNPKKVNFATLYYLYGLERAGILLGTEKFGPHEWYPIGANHLLDTQRSPGVWDSGSLGRAGGPVVDSCFAILFLRRGTVPLKPPPPPPPPVATGDTGRRG